MIPWPTGGRTRALALAVALAGSIGVAACGGSPRPAIPASRPSILLVTLDTTRVDAVGPGATGISTPAFNALAARGRRFAQAYATVPETLPSHASIMTGLYPGGHGVHENARTLDGRHPLLAERLRQAGYRTAAFVSSFVLARRFGLARGFDVYDDDLEERGVERSSVRTTDRALDYLSASSTQPVLMWVHYFDPHTPYAPPEPFRSRYAATPYLGEVAAMDQQIGRLVEAFERQATGPVAIVVAADHGEGLGDHGESQHGNLLYQSTMHVPLVVVGPGFNPGDEMRPVSTRRIFHTVLDWAGLGNGEGLRAAAAEVVLGEAMKPFLEYGWQPQVMAVGDLKAILAGRLEVYDLARDPAEASDLGSGANLPAAFRRTLEEYPVPSPEAARAPDTLSEDARRRLSSLGYVSAGAAPAVRRDAPRPVEMVRLFEHLEQASGLFVAGRYAEALPLLEQILAEDTFNLDARLRLATAHSALGHEAEAMAAFRRAAETAPRSSDVRTYLALHYARGPQWERAVPLLETIVAESPDRLPAVEALATIRERQGRLGDAVDLRRKIHALRTPSAIELTRLGQLAMEAQQTPVAIESFEQARARQGTAFAHDLELGVLYLASRRLGEARDALDRIPAAHRDYPMALFKRGQVAVLLNEPDKAARIARATERADPTTRPLIARERLFQSAR